ncbi:unnamed protein product [Phaedon cochleariae]|uniref:DUF4806 domain-containing protein n=1 Tax=Phaedon cochleariae TaxID=80249 RepID=A0A9N9SL62_PHACE|nr:unnamed protein product [Phaedon cochleariae]
MVKKHTEVTPKPNRYYRDQDDPINDSTPLPTCSNADNFTKSRCDTPDNPDIIMPDGHSTPTSMRSIGGNSTPRFVTSNLNKINSVDDKEFKRQVLTKLNIIMAKLNGHDEQLEAMNNLLENCKPKNGEDETPATGLELLPVNNDDSLAVCEQFLSDKMNLRKLMVKKHTEVTPKPNRCYRDQDDPINDSTPLPTCSNADNFTKSRCDTPDSPDIIMLDGHSTPTSMRSIGGNSTPRFVTSNLNKINSVDDKEFKRQVLTKLNIIMAKLNGHDEQLEAMNNLLENCKPKNGEDETPATGLELLPVNNDDSLAVCEQFLSDEMNLRKLARELSRMGGTTVPEITRKLLYKIITNEFAELYSWEGGKGKRKFINVTLSRLVIDAVQCNKRTQNACEDEIIQEVKRWLAKAKERVKNELKKTERFAEWKAILQLEKIASYSSQYCYDHFRICSFHFDEKMFASMQKNRLKKSDIPIQPAAVAPSVAPVIPVELLEVTKTDEEELHSPSTSRKPEMSISQEDHQSKSMS